MLLLSVTFEFLVIEQNSIPYIWQVIFSYVTVKGRIVDPYVNGLFESLDTIFTNIEVFLSCIVA